MALLTSVALVAAVLSATRWIRVMQREHYIPGAAVRFAVRWWTCQKANRTLVGAAIISAALSFLWPLVGLACCAIVMAGPVGLGLRGRTAPLNWTPRARRLAVVLATFCGGVVLAGAVLMVLPQTVVLTGLAMPLLVDAATAAARPLEYRLSRRYVRQASLRMRRIKPLVVAITGSYGKTSTKEYVRHLLRSSANVVASPASYNNELGLARAINEGVAPGVEIFVAEMGAYRKGEIADLCRWITPKVSVITAIAPVHLERFGSLEAIVAAKTEILDSADVVVVNADEPLIMDALLRKKTHARIIRCSTTDASADVYLSGGASRMELFLYGEALGSLDGNVFPINLACAVGVASALKVPSNIISTLLHSLPSPSHRRKVLRLQSGVTVIDNTFNSNPVSSDSSLKLLAQHGAIGVRRVVVTPGMVELGPLQYDANREFAAKAAAVADDLLVVGCTNQRALIDGARDGSATLTLVDTRDQAVAWIRENLRSEDVVLYENDLPDHYP